jgi:hypothetical protein
MPCGKESSPRIAIGRKLLTEEPSCEAEDMTAPTTRATPKIALDQRATSRHDNARPPYPAASPIPQNVTLGLCTCFG